MFFSKFETFLAFRYIRSRRVEGFISVSAWFSLVGIAIGVATLIIVMSVMNGFRTDLINRVLGINGHLMVFSKNSNSISNYNSIVEKVSDNNYVLAAIPQINGQALARSNEYVQGVIIKGIRSSDLPAKKILWKSLDDITKDNFSKKKEIIVGHRLAKNLNIKIGDNLTLISASGIKTVLGVIPQKTSFRVGGVFDVGMYEYDNNFVFIPWEKAKTFLQINDMVNNLEIFIKNHKNTQLVENLITKKIGKDYIVIDWKKNNSTFINALNVEKNVMFLILTLIILVAAFNIISSMTMLVNAKSADVALLRTMGASKESIIKIFILVGTSIGFLGTFLGSVLGVFLSINIEYLKIFLSYVLNQELFSPEIYFLSTLPSEINYMEVFNVIITSLSLSVLASIFPSWKASKIFPAEVLRYE